MIGKYSNGEGDRGLPGKGSCFFSPAEIFKKARALSGIIGGLLDKVIMRSRNY